jgi:pseudouridine synthase
MPAERLQKLMAAAGLCSRRRAEELISAGRVRVNGAVAELGDRADPDADRVELDGQALPSRPAPILLLLNKPAGVLCTCHDPQGRPTVLDLLPRELAAHAGLHPVGRLDADSRGALLLTNDGALTLRLSHPRFAHTKTYRVQLAGQPSPACLQRWRRGLPLDGQPALPVGIEPLRHSAGSCWLELTMREGRNRQIRRTASALGHPVLDLQRVAIGPIQLGTLPEGQWRHLAGQEWPDQA